MDSSDIGLNLERIIFIGRTFEEYRDIFNLSNEDILNNKILDCPAGACSFTSIANRLGGDVTAADIAYSHPVQQLKKKGLLDVEHGIENIGKVKQNYVWNYFKTVDELRSSRMGALTDCTDDMCVNSNRYLAATLPQLPFQHNQFDITLSAHFLFMYSDRLDLSFHQATIRELMRVTRKEIRVFPILDLASERSTHLDPIINLIEEAGWNYEIQNTGYEFQRNVKQLLRIYNKDNSI
ncbi:SAM-dependent methyltransferase [Paenibacillus sp. MER 99-2]|uniref:SAM-dependent methyltransferase n=1 Tax=Paenibacillus sp. MER 99-2 TaxID=2939572 RepID=UPI0020419061|nr:SAM-dependent methyltransferase [Paenibacillus sp. MER 99-2]MCM3172692.1 SAM-dependent methyltransferase [Paenibacillus sp. MER 99-2]